MAVRELESLQEMCARGLAAAKGLAEEAANCAGGCGSMLPYPATICDPCRMRRERGRRVEANLRSIPAELGWARFDSPLLEGRVRAPRLLSEARSAATLPRVLLQGPAGTGKSVLVVAMLRERLERSPDLHAYYCPAWRLGKAHSRAEDSMPESYGRAVRCDLLVLDDLGNERDIPSNPVPDVLFERFDDGRPTWITTGLRIDELRRRYGDGVARRVFTRTAIIDCGASDNEQEARS